VHVKRIGTLVPPTTWSIPDLGERLGLTPAQVRLHTKFFGQERIAVADGLDIVDMLVPAGREALQGNDPDSVRYLIYAHTVQHIAPPSRAVLDRVRRELGLRNASAFALSQQNCVAGLYAVRLAQYLLHNAPDGAHALIMAGEKAFSPRLQVIKGTTIMGEATSACLVGNDEGGHEVLAIAVRTLGRFYRCNDCSDELKSEYEQLYGNSLVAVMREALDDAGLIPDDVAMVLPHNVNRYSWRQVARDAGIPFSRVYLDNVARIGHCFGADPFINFADALAARRIGPGDVVLMATAGLGATFAAIAVRVGERANQ
jgi:3-oxoacyl-[acyl-carrier-protein] synthase-3